MLYWHPTFDNWNYIIYVKSIIYYLLFDLDNKYIDNRWWVVLGRLFVHLKLNPLYKEDPVWLNFLLYTCLQTKSSS